MPDNNNPTGSASSIVVDTRGSVEPTFRLPTPPPPTKSDDNK